jgi:UDP-glucose 4-epimerase
VSRVLVTGGVGTIGAAIVRRLLSDPSYEVRVSDHRAAPQWMREGCEIHTGDLHEPEQAIRAMRGCTHIIHLAAVSNVAADFHHLPYTMIEANSTVNRAVTRAALDLDVERFTYVSSCSVFERASEFPSTEAHLSDCPVPRSALGFSMLTGEVCCRAAQVEHGLPFTICRTFGAYGPGEMADAQPDGAEIVLELISKTLRSQRPLEIPGSGEQKRTLTHVEDLAEGIVTAMSSPAALNEDFNLSRAGELTVAQIAQIIWIACGEDPDDFEPKYLSSLAPRVERYWPSVEKAKRLLGWEARIEFEDGIAASVEWFRERAAIGSGNDR